MTRKLLTTILAPFLVAGLDGLILANSDHGVFQLQDIFELEYAGDPQISPDGHRIVYVRTFMDIMSDRRSQPISLQAASE